MLGRRGKWLREIPFTVNHAGVPTLGAKGFNQLEN